MLGPARDVVEKGIFLKGKAQHVAIGIDDTGFAAPRSVVKT
jgi:hypothetical protein